MDVSYKVIKCDGYKFRFHRLLKNGVQRWNCCTKSCKSYLKTNNDYVVVEFGKKHKHPRVPLSFSDLSSSVEVLLPRKWRNEKENFDAEEQLKEETMISLMGMRSSMVENAPHEQPSPSNSVSSPNLEKCKGIITFKRSSSSIELNKSKAESSLNINFKEELLEPKGDISGQSSDCISLTSEYPTPKKLRLEESGGEINKGFLDAPETNLDQVYNSFGRYVAASLLRLPPMNRLSAEMAISQVLVTEKQKVLKDIKETQTSIGC